MNTEKDSELIEEALIKAFNDQHIPEIPENWQEQVMFAVRQEANSTDKSWANAENLIFKLSWVAAGIAAILVIIFSIFFIPLNEKGSWEEDLNNLYVDKYTNEILTVNLQ